MIAQRDEEIRTKIIRDPLNRTFVCVICQFSGSSRHKVFCHIESKHYQDPNISYTCPYCYKLLSSRNALGAHMSRSHRGESKNSIFPKDAWVNLYLLDEALESEIRSKMFYLGGGQWQCTDCKLITKSTNLYNHIEGKHVNSGGHHCQLCGKFCKTKNGLIAHNHRTHSKNMIP